MIIEADNIRKSFGGLEVLKGVDFQAEEAETVAIMGASGAGKSTLLQILGTLMTPDSGSVRIDGTLIGNLSPEKLAGFRCKRIGFVFQSHHLLPEFTAQENVMIPQLIAGKSRREAAERAVDLLGTVGLSHRLGHKSSQLSGGEQQRVAIARALANSPAILFADEPTGNLDSSTKREISGLLLSMRERLGLTVVIVTHDPELADLCGRTLKMKDGQFL